MTPLKLALITLCCLLVVSGGLYLSSGVFARKLADLTGHATVCVDGVNYVQFSSGASVKYNVNGTISTCN